MPAESVEYSGNTTTHRSASRARSRVREDREGVPRAHSRAPERRNNTSPNAKLEHISQSIQPALGGNIHDVEEWSRIRSDIEVLKQENGTLRSDKQGLKAEATRQRRESERWRREANEYRGRCEHYEGLYGHYRGRYEHYKGRFQETQYELQSAQKLLKLRTDELANAERFLHKADQVSEAQVLSMVHCLNGRSAQLASILMDNADFSANTSRWSTEEKEILQETVKPWIGDDMTDMLLSRPREEDYAMVHVGLLWAISHYAVTMVHSWASGKGEQGLLRQIYMQIAAKEPQAVLAQWRMLTYRAIEDLDTTSDTALDDSNYVMDVLRSVLELSGAARRDLHEDQAAMKMVCEIVEQCLEIRHVIREKIASTDLMLLSYGNGLGFHSDFMEDIDSSRRKSGGNSEGDPVVCTTDLGLLRFEGQPGPNDQARRTRSDVLLKAKVLLGPA